MPLADPERFAEPAQPPPGLGLLHRPTVKPALPASFAWTLVWWFGEGLGMVFMDMGAPQLRLSTGL